MTTKSRCAISDAEATQPESDDPSVALREAAEAAQLPYQPGTLVRYGSNAVYRLPGEVIARVSRPGVSPDGARKQVVVARWLESVGYPAARVIDVDQPVEADGRAVTFWRSATDVEEYAPLNEVGNLIRELHALETPTHIELPELKPFGKDWEALPEYSGLASADAEFLRERYDWARLAFDALPYELEPGLIHGDANVGNVLLDRNGLPVLIDLDSVATGPREWDLIQTALFYDRLGWHTAEEYAAFVKAYGYDLREWQGYEDLADIREIAMTSWLSRQAATSEKSAREAAKRIDAIRTGGSRRDWSAY
jgi:thiamine kinase-like enzyme